MAMRRPFELSSEDLQQHLEEMVDAVFSDLVSEFLLMPMGKCFPNYIDFRDAYEILKRASKAFGDFSEATVNIALEENSRVLGVIRSILGMTAPEWAEFARSELDSDVTQGAARTLDRRCREDPGYIRKVLSRYRDRIKNSRTSDRNLPIRPKTLERLDQLISIAITYIVKGAPEHQEGFIHRLAKFDTQSGLESLRYAAEEDIPYAVLLYERYLGRPFAGHRDAVSELVGEVMENAVEERLRNSGVSYRKTGRAGRIPALAKPPISAFPMK